LPSTYIQNILEHFTSFPSAYEWKNPGAGYFFGAKIGEDDNFECGYFETSILEYFFARKPPGTPGRVRVVEGQVGQVKLG